MSIKSRNWDQLSWDAELPKRFSINPRGSDKCKYIGRVVAMRASFTSSTEKFPVRLISVVNARRGRRGRPREPNEDGPAIHFATRKLTNRILRFRSELFLPRAPFVILVIYKIAFRLNTLLHLYVCTDVIITENSKFQIN